jgi:tRNA (guanine37-N1)-methyltransferase
MRIDIITVLPELLDSPFSHSIMKRAREKGLLEVNLHNLRDHTPYKQGQVDDYQFGGGAGMVMMPEPLAILIELLQKETKYDEVIYMTPDGPLFDQKTANNWRLCTKWWRAGRCSSC